MASHFAPSKKNKLQLPSLRIPALPRLFPREKRSYAPKRYQRAFSMQDMLVLIAATLIFILGLLLPLPGWASVCVFALSALLALLPLFLRVLHSLLKKKIPDEDALVILAVLAAFCIGEGVGGAIAAILYRLAQILEAYAIARGDAAFDLLRDRLPEKARLVIGEETHEVMPETVDPGQIVRVLNGEAVPLDGRIVSGVTELDQSALTGKDKVRTCGVGDEVFSGSVNRGTAIDLEVTRPFSSSAAASLLHDVETAARYETTPERITDRVCVWLGPALAALALLIAIVPPLLGGSWQRWIRCGVIFLLISSPSALAISVSLACFGGEVSAVLKGILSRGHDCFEILAQVKTMVFGKTGTITEGRFEIAGVFPNGGTKEELLAVAATAESFSHHPIALLLKYAANWDPEMAGSVMQVEEIPGRGVSAFLEGRHVYVGNAQLLQEHDIPYRVPSRAGAAIHVAVEGRYLGHIMINDRTREGAFDALESLRSQGVNQLVMLTGDVLSSSRPLAASLGFDLMRTELTPQAKVSAIRYLISGKGNRTSVGFVGDGINDVPMLEAADVGIALDALSAWNEADSADLLLLDDDLQLLPAAMRIARSLRFILLENLGFLLGVKLIVLLLALGGVLSIPLAALLSSFSSALALLNALRAFGLDS